MRYAPPRLLSPGRDPLEDGGLGGCHMQDGDAVGRVLGADRSEDVLVPDSIPHRPIDPHMLAVQHGCRLSDFNQVARLATGVYAGAEAVVRNIALPLWHRCLKDVGVHVHYLVDREVIFVVHPVHHVRLARAHCARRVDEPRVCLALPSRDNGIKQPVLQFLPLVGVDAVVRRVQHVADVGVLSNVHGVGRRVPICVACAGVVVVVLGNGKLLPVHPGLGFNRAAPMLR
mmetsp:Transcript_13469/g.43962  ORF Transcript_13469/g.43962 Transcript_13469/m.43962 type:complete len:229 (+) Transcript_13469:341-1027(+)